MNGMKVSVTKLENGGAVLVISGPGTKDILDTADQLGINPQDYVIETLRHELKLRQLVSEHGKAIKKLIEEGYKAKAKSAKEEHHDL